MPPVTSTRSRRVRGHHEGTTAHDQGHRSARRGGAAGGCLHQRRPRRDGIGGGGSGADGAGDSTGVTDDTVKIGWPTIDQAALVEAGLATDFGDITDVAEAVVEDWNADGGVNGRRVELVTRTFGTDIANLLPDMQRVCLELTEDEEVFATVAFTWFGDAVTCVAGDHDTPLLVQTSLSSTVLDTGNDNIVLANFTWEDALASSVRVVDDAGELDDLETDRCVRAARAGHARGDRRRARACARGGRHRDRRRRHGALRRRRSTTRRSPRWSAASRPRTSTRCSRSGNFFFNGAFMTEARAAGLPPDLRHVGPLRGHRRPHPAVRAGRAARQGRSAPAGRASRPTRCRPTRARPASRPTPPTPRSR